MARIASSPPAPDSRGPGGQGLPLSRTMLSDHKSPYVGRFACDWPRLSTTDPHAAHVEWYRGRPAQRLAASPQTVSTSSRLTTYGSMLAFGRRSSIHPFLFLAVCQGMRIDAPRSDVP